MPDPVPLGLQKPTLPSTSQRRETLWAYGSHHFPQSGCTTGSIHPDVSTQPCPLSPSQPSVTGLDTSPPLLPPSLTLCSPPKPTRTCPHHGQGPARARHWTGATSVLLLLGGSAADPPTHQPHRSPWLPAPRPPPRGGGSPWLPAAQTGAPGSRLHRPEQPTGSAFMLVFPRAWSWVPALPRRYILRAPVTTHRATL